MTSETSGDMRRLSYFIGNIGYWQILIACVASVIFHVLIAHNWRPPAAEPLMAKPPQIMEVALVTPQLPEPEVKLVEPPKPKAVKPVVKPKAKPLAKPKAKPEPVVPPKPVESKAPPKVLQKTFTEAAPEVKASKPAYAPIPVFGTPAAKPSKSLVSSNATKTTKPPSPAAGNTQGGSANSGVQVIQRVKPKYPSRALSRHMEGYVTIQFTVNASGQVENPTVTSASPSGVFDDAALAAIRQFKFKPKMVNGAPVSQRSVQTINFKLDR